MQIYFRQKLFIWKFFNHEKKCFCRGQVHTWQHQFLSRGSLLEPGPRHPKDRRGLCQLYLFKRKFPSDEQSILYSTDFIQTTIGPRVCAIILYLAGSRLVSSWNRENRCLFERLFLLTKRQGIMTQICDLENKHFLSHI